MTHPPPDGACELLQTTAGSGREHADQQQQANDTYCHRVTTDLEQAEVVAGPGKLADSISAEPSQQLHSVAMQAIGVLTTTGSVVCCHVLISPVPGTSPGLTRPSLMLILRVQLRNEHDGYSQ